MGRKVFLFITSYPFAFILILSFVTVKQACSQQLTAYNSSAGNSNLFCLGIGDKSSNTYPFYFTPITTDEPIPGPYKFRPDPGTLSSNAFLKSVDSSQIAVNDADSMDSKDVVATNQMLSAPAPVSEQPPVNRYAKPAPNPSAAIIDEETDIIVNKYAEMISVSPDEVNNLRLYRFIDQWYGVRYKWGGSDNTGIDCSGFSQKLYNTIYGLTIERTAKQQHRSSEIIKEYRDANEGDLVFFRMRHLGISHVGIYLANGYFVHSSRSHGVTISSIEDKYWRRRYAGCGRVQREDISGTESGSLQ